MKRLLGSSWKRIGLQVGLLAGIGLAFALGTHEEPAVAGGNPECPGEDECTFKKPNIMIIMDYSTSMNTVWQDNMTRWEVLVAAIKQVTQAGSFLSQNTHLALLRYGHDPAPASAGTMIMGDASGLVDGNSLDVPWYDDQNLPWYECNGAAIGTALDTVGAPMGGNLTGIGTWTKGAMERTKTLIDEAKAAHPEDMGARAYLNVLVTDGAWTGVNGTTPLAPASENPAITAADLFDNQQIPTYVVTVSGDAQAEAAADETAAAGGTMAAVDGDTPELLAMALANVVQQIIDSVVAPECVGGLPRVMVLLDASSSMLNIEGGTSFGGPGETGWDQAREALAGADSLFDIEAFGGQAVEDLVHLGLAVFGHNAPAPGEQKILVNYGPCMKDNFNWALDPNTSCEMPGCDDPWGGPPITWTFKDGQANDPFFDQPTVSAMPQCAGATFCSGSGTYTHLGLQLIKNNKATYLADAMMPNAQFPATDSTQFINILITDGQYTGYSTNAQVQGELEQMFNDGITTYVIGFGDGVDSPAAVTQLNNMADWGSGGANDYYDANNQVALEQALADIIAGIDFDQCCAFNDCSENPEPTTDEPDPVPSDDSTDTGMETTDTTEEESTTDDPTTEESTTDDPTTDESTEESTDTAEDDTTTGTGTDTNTSNDDEIGEDESETAGETGGADEDDGCNCSVPDSNEGKTRGLLGSLLVLGFAGLVRRRRRSA